MTNSFLRKLILTSFIITLTGSLFWTVGKFINTDLPAIERQTWSIMSGIKWLTAIVLYIAWRVTPKE